jgi:hypothetical protein
MDTLLKPARLDLDPNSPTATKEWRHWHRTFTNFIDECGDKAPDQYRTLVNYVSHNVYEYIEDCKDYLSRHQMKYLLDICSQQDGRNPVRLLLNFSKNFGNLAKIVTLKT